MQEQIGLRRNISFYASRLLLYLSMSLLALMFMIPFLWMYSSSLRPVPEIFKYIMPFTWRTFIPQRFTLLSYVKVLFHGPFPRYILNTFFVATVTTFLGLFVNSLAAYAFARIRFPGRELIFALFLATIMIPFEVTAIPLFLVMRVLGWVDTFQALIVPGIANAFYIFLLRQFFRDIPRDLEDAARIDGCSRFGTYWRVILPLSWPALITLGFMTFQAQWDAFIWPLIITNSPAVRVIQIAIANLASADAVFWDEIFAAVAIAALPPILLFLIFQRYYVRGITMTGLKG